MSRKLQKNIVLALLLFCYFVPAAHAAYITLTGDSGRADARLTLQSGTPVADVISSNTIYLDACDGCQMAAFDTVRQIWVVHPITAESGCLLSGLTVGGMYSMYGYWNGTNWALDPPVAWINSTTADSQVYLNGVWVKASDYSRRYLGCFQALTSSTTSDCPAHRLLANAQKLKPRICQALDTKTAWSSMTNHTVPFPADNDTTDGVNRISFVQAVPGPVEASTFGVYPVSGGGQPALGLGFDSTSVFTVVSQSGITSTDASFGGYSQIGMTNHCNYGWSNVFGAHYIQRLECNWTGAYGAIGANGLAPSGTTFATASMPGNFDGLTVRLFN